MKEPISHLCIILKSRDQIAQKTRLSKASWKSEECRGSWILGFSCVRFDVGIIDFKTSFQKFAFHASVLLLINEFRHNIVKVAADLRGDSRADPQTTLTML